MNKQRKQIIEGNAISEVCTFRLGAVDQKVMIEGKTADLPVVITLHGGPGMPIPFCVGCRGLFPEVTGRCILVCWDQYGSGINNAVLPADFSVADLVEMTCDLIDAVKDRFPNNRLYLFGMSWGSVLAAKAAVRREQCLSGVITYGQALYRLMRSEDTLEAIRSSKAPAKVKAEAEEMIGAETVSYGQAMKLSKLVRKYTSGYNHPQEPKEAMGGLLKGLLFSPDYRFSDFFAIVKNGYMKNHNVAEELSTLDLREDLRRVRVPYHIIQGDADVVTSTKLIRNFVREADNPNLTLTVVPTSAHMPGKNGMQAITDEIDRIHSVS